MSDCPPYHYCDGNTTYPYGKLCENGFYGELGVFGYDGPDKCLSCIQGSFCTAGRIVGECAPGFICNAEADSHTPRDETSTTAYPCPLGNYCGEGATEPTPCPLGTFTFEVAAKQEVECTICQLGWYCPGGGVDPAVCPEGTYCGFG